MDFEGIHAIPIASLVVSDSDELVAGNAALHAIFPNLQLGRNFWSVLRHPNLGILLDQARQGQRPATTNFTIRTPITVSFQATASRFGSSHVLVCLQDINETANAVQLRKDFIADLSHELRTPLTAIQGVLETAADDPVALAHFLPTLTDQTTRMNGLVNELLTLSRIENNERRRPESKIHLQKIIHDVHAFISPSAQAAGLHIELILPTQDIYLQADEHQLYRAIVNLAQNAIRYGTDGKQVVIKVSVRTAKQIVIDVIDFGAGVDDHHLPRLTERFYRSDAHRAQSDGGHGLGLAIVKHIVIRHRGQLSLSNLPNRGFKASVILPV